MQVDSSQVRERLVNSLVAEESSVITDEQASSSQVRERLMKEPAKVIEMMNVCVDDTCLFYICIHI